MNCLCGAAAAAAANADVARRGEMVMGEARGEEVGVIEPARGTSV